LPPEYGRRWWSWRGAVGLETKLASVVGHGRDLIVALVEIECGVELRLAHEQFFHTGFVIEGLVGLRLKVGEGFPETQIERCQGATQGNDWEAG
jgi:hypothetical protein